MLFLKEITDLQLMSFLACVHYLSTEKPFEGVSPSQSCGLRIGYSQRKVCEEGVINGSSL